MAGGRHNRPRDRAEARLADGNASVSGRRVLVIGAGGNLGLRLVARGISHGHHVTAFVRDAARLAERLGALGVAPVPTIEGDAFDSVALTSAIAGNDAVVSAAGTAADGDIFAELFACIFDAACRTLPAPRRIWMVAGLPAMTIPHAELVAAGLPGVPKMHRMHEADWRLVEGSNADWSLMCPGPMIPARGGQIRQDLRVSVDVVPFDVPRWTGWMPRFALSLLMRQHLDKVVVSYEDVAELMMANLDDGGPFSRRRVGVALPRGKRGRR